MYIVHHVGKLLEPSRLHELHESKLPFVSLAEFIRSENSFLFARITGLLDGSTRADVDLLKTKKNHPQNAERTAQ